MKNLEERYAPFIGSVVLLQLKIPLLMVQVSEQQKIPYAKDPAQQWIPGEILVGPETDPLPVVREYVRYAVVESIGDGLLEFSWRGPGPLATLRSLVHLTDVAAITRITEPPAEPSLISLAR